MKKILTIVFALLVASNVWAFDFEIEGIYYNVIDGGVEVTYQTTDYNSYSGSVTIPETVTNDETTYSVISIGTKAFMNCNELTEISIPSCVKTIGDYVFYGCSALTTITLPDGINSIGYCLFYNCSSLAEIIIPNSVASIRGYAFLGCNSLKSIIIPSGVKSIEPSLFFSCSLMEIKVAPENTVYDSRDNCNAIIETATNTLIAGCSNTIIPEGITTIKYYAFSNKILTSIVIPKSVTTIDKRAIDGTIALAEIKIDPENSVYDSRNNCNAIIETATNTLIRGCNNTVIPDGITTIEIYAFSNSKALSSVTIPNTVTAINEGAFWGCSGLSSIVIPSSVKSMTSYPVFGNCSGLTEMKVETGNTVFDSRDNCNAIIKTSTNTLFAGCKSTVIPEGVTAIGNYALMYCGFSSFIIPEEISSIGKQAFYYCKDLKRLICKGVVPPEIDGELFSSESFYKSVCLYVPREAMEAYKADAVWGKFEIIKCIESEEVSLENDDVVVVPDKYEAVFSMPFSESADFYTLIIQNKGVTFCTITFNAQGHLTDINYSLNKSYDLKESVVGFQFTVTGLSEGTDYTYQFVAEKSDDSLFKEYTGSFRTTGTATAVVNVEQNNNITIVNNQILVNGEAPAFVVTVLGQKIANANLKAGVYFVVVNGETVGVSVW